MSVKRVIGRATLLGFATTLFIGCTGSTDVKLQEAPPVQRPPATPVPKDVKAGGGPGSSGHMTKSPGADS
jgi:hypothetical protein